MLVHPQFDPVAIHLGPLAVRWYGLTYLIGFGLIWAIGRYAIRRRTHSVWSYADLDDALFYGILGTFHAPGSIGVIGFKPTIKSESTFNIGIAF